MAERQAGAERLVVSEEEVEAVKVGLGMAAERLVGWKVELAAVVVVVAMVGVAVTVGGAVKAAAVVEAGPGARMVACSRLRS